MAYVIHLKKLNQTLDINGVSVKVYVTVSAEFEAEPTMESFDFRNKAKNDSYWARFILGELEAYFITVEARALGEVGSDVLGGCHVSTVSAEQDLIELSKMHGMVGTALLDLEAKIIKKAAFWAPYVTKNGG